MPDTDVWATWLRTGRDGGSAWMRAENLDRLATVRDLILERAGLRPGETVLDVGAGQGLLGLGALERVGPDGMVSADRPGFLWGYMARAAGFQRVETLTELALAPPPVRDDLDVFLDTAPNPLAPTTRALMAAALSSGEAERFTASLSQALHDGRGERRHAMTFLRAWR